jgi:hypothetical protein
MRLVPVTSSVKSGRRVGISDHSKGVFGVRACVRGGGRGGSAGASNLLVKAHRRLDPVSALSARKGTRK